MVCGSAVEGPVIVVYKVANLYKHWNQDEPAGTICVKVTLRFSK